MFLILKLKSKLSDKNLSKPRLRSGRRY